MQLVSYYEQCSFYPTNSLEHPIHESWSPSLVVDASINVRTSHGKKMGTLRVNHDGVEAHLAAVAAHGPALEQL